MVFFFFFSSRRRHTRFDCDWSSDVCSSDLLSGNVQKGEAAIGERPQADPTVEIGKLKLENGSDASCQNTDSRSEEHTSELQSQSNLVCRLLLEKKKNSTTSTPLPSPVSRPF